MNFPMLQSINLFIVKKYFCFFCHQSTTTLWLHFHMAAVQQWHGHSNPNGEILKNQCMHFYSSRAAVVQMLSSKFLTAPEVIMPQLQLCQICAALLNHFLYFLFKTPKMSNMSKHDIQQWEAHQASTAKIMHMMHPLLSTGISWRSATFGAASPKLWGRIMQCCWWVLKDLSIIFI